MTQVWKLAPYSEGTLLALLALADWSDDDGICWPKVEQLAEKARLTRSGAQYCLRKLLADGAIEIAKESPGPGKPRTYKLSAQYLNPSPKRGLVKREKGLSNPLRNKEEPSLTVIKKNTKCAQHPNSGLTQWGTCWDCYYEKYSGSFGVEPPAGAAV